MNDNTQIKLGPPRYVATPTVYDYSNRRTSFKTLEEARNFATEQVAKYGDGYYISMEQQIELIGEEEPVVALYHQRRDDKCGGVDCDDRENCSCLGWAMDRAS